MIQVYMFDYNHIRSQDVTKQMSSLSSSEQHPHQGTNRTVNPC